MKGSLIQERISRLAEGIQADCLFAAPEPRGRAGCNCRRGDVRCCRQTFPGSAYRQPSGNRDQNLIISEWAVILPRSKPGVLSGCIARRGELAMIHDPRILARGLAFLSPDVEATPRTTPTSFWWVSP